MPTHDAAWRHNLPDCFPYAHPIQHIHAWGLDQVGFERTLWFRHLALSSRRTAASDHTRQGARIAPVQRADTHDVIIGASPGTPLDCVCPMNVPLLPCSCLPHSCEMFHNLATIFIPVHHKPSTYYCLLYCMGIFTQVVWFIGESLRRCDRQKTAGRGVFRVFASLYPCDVRAPRNYSFPLYAFGVVAMSLRK
jgi:hypothetical protein